MLTNRVKIDKMKKRHFLTLICASVLFPQTPLANEPTIHAEGSFTSGVTSGKVYIIQIDKEWFVKFRDDFLHEGSPDPWVALGKDGYQRSGLIAELKQFKGTQKHKINPKIEALQFNEVYIWCEQHNTSLGRAKLIWQKP